MTDALIENPILNSPFHEPERHFKFIDEGITNEIVGGRRSSSYFIPIARPKKKGKQLAFDTEWTQDRIEENKTVNRIRQRIGMWRDGGYVGVTPTTGRIRNASTDDIACWFIDTDYNGESFFVRHAYFTGADEPYEKLKRALKAEIDEAAWSSLYSTKSRPFPKPASKKIAVKEINHYGDEVLKIIPL
jgi:hypothetical protein